MNASKCALIEFLSEHQYDHPISRKLLTRPTSKDFNNILLFLFRKVDTNYRPKTNVRMEEAISSMFKTMKYPFGISKTALVAVGSPHTWPALLASVSWLVELLTYDEEVTNNSDSDLENEGDKLFFDYLSSSYQSFLAGDDESSNALYEELVSNFDERDVAYTEEIENLDQEAAQLEQDIDKASNATSALPEKEAKLRNVQSDLKKFESIVKKFEVHKEALASKISTRQQDVKTKSEELATIQAQIKRLHVKIDSQELSALDVQRLGQEKSRLQDGLAAASNHKKVLEEKLWETEMQLSKKNDEVEELVHKYNSTAMSMHLIPATAKYAGGTEYELKLKSGASEGVDHHDDLDSFFSVNLKGIIRPALLRVKGSATQRMHTAREEDLEVADEAEVASEAIGAAKQEVAKLESRVQQAEQQLKQEKQHMKATVNEKAEGTEAIELQIQQLRSGDHTATAPVLSQKQKVFEKAEAELAAAQAKWDEEKQELHSSIWATLQQLAEHKAEIQKTIEFTRAYCTEKNKAISDAGDEALEEVIEEGTEMEGGQ
jgi:kinetochore protein NDC80